MMYRRRTDSLLQISFISAIILRGVRMNGRLLSFPRPQMIRDEMHVPKNIVVLAIRIPTCATSSAFLY